MEILQSKILPTLLESEDDVGFPELFYW